MSTRFIRHEIDGEALYLAWSSVVDAPTTKAMPLRGFALTYDPHFHGDGISFDDMLAKYTEDAATFNFRNNRAGANETCLTRKQIIDWYFVRRSIGKKPRGKR